MVVKENLFRVVIAFFALLACCNVYAKDKIDKMTAKAMSTVVGTVKSIDKASGVIAVTDPNGKEYKVQFAPGDTRFRQGSEGCREGRSDCSYSDSGFSAFYMTSQQHRVWVKIHTAGYVGSENQPIAKDISFLTVLSQ